MTKSSLRNILKEKFVLWYFHICFLSKTQNILFDIYLYIYNVSIYYYIFINLYILYSLESKSSFTFHQREKWVIIFIYTKIIN